MLTILRLLAAAAIAIGVTSISSAETPVLKAAVLKVGTVNWELDTIKHFGYDKANGFELQVTGMAGIAATRIALQAGEADIAVADWVWVARQRADGKDFVFLPYSKSVGSLMVKNDSPATSLADLKDKKIGIAGGPVDKSWLIMRAYAKKELGFDLAVETEQVFGAPPLIFKTALAGGTDGAINFWHFAAKMQTRNMRPLLTVADAAETLGLDPELPLLGYVVPGSLLKENPDLVAGLVAASRAAKNKLQSDETAWDRLRPMMRAKSDADFAALKSGFIAGIPGAGPIDRGAAAQMLEIMAEFGGSDLVGAATTLPDGVFVDLAN